MGSENIERQPDKIDRIKEAKMPSDALAARSDVAERPPAPTVEGIRDQIAAVQQEIKSVVRGVLDGSGFQDPGLQARVTEFENTEGMKSGSLVRQAIAESPNLDALNRHV